MEAGQFGQFDVMADGALVASRGGGWLSRALGGGWPDDDRVVSDLKRRGGAPIDGESTRPRSTGP